MRVLMVSKACVVGIYQRKLELMAQQDIDLLVLVPPSWKDERGEQRLERVYTAGYRLETIPIVFNGNFHLHFYPSLGKIIHEFKPDILHIDEEPYNLATWQMMHHARQNGAKTLFFSWQNIHRDYPPPFSWGEKWVLNHADYALVGTDSAGEVWRAKGYTGAIKTLPQFGTDPDTFQFISPAEQPDRPFTIGYIGRLVEEKGVHLLLDACAKLTSEWCLRIIGGGPERENLEAQAKSLNINQNVTFIDQLPSTEIYQEYHKLDVLVLPSLTRPNWKEQFGRVLVEAMASGVPVIGSDSGAIAGVVGDSGVIVPEEDVSALVDALTTLRDCPEKQEILAQLGRKRFLANFTHQQIADETVAVYHEMLS